MATSSTSGQTSIGLPGPSASTITMHNIHYTVQVKKGANIWATEDKVILRDVSANFKPGMNAILGPSGCGKTTLLDVLAGRKDPRGLSGTILVDGHRQPSHFKCMAGYVVQDDVMMGTLTVRENVMFSANLRLPSTVSKQSKANRVEDLLVEMGLTRCADSRVGSDFIRGISGGERKRTNIAMELVICPPVLFLDEPTTGLDSSTANAVIKLLQRQAQKDRTIIFSIHQPKYVIYKCFENLLMLSSGQTVYLGPCEQALGYFCSIGYDYEKHHNPANFLLDVITGERKKTICVERAEERHENISVHNSDVESEEICVQASANEPAEATLVDQLSDHYRRSDLCVTIQREIEAVFREYETNREQRASERVQAGIYATSFTTQLRFVGARSILNVFWNPRTAFMQCLSPAIFALVIGIIFFQVDNNVPTGIQNRVGAVYAVTMLHVFGNVFSVELFIQDKVLFLHESSNGFYRVSVYFLAKFFCDLVPMRLLPVTVQCCITYFMIGFRVGVSKFFIFYLTMFLTAMAASSTGFLVSASVNLRDMATSCLYLVFGTMMIFGGFLVNLDSMATWLRWLQYFSLFKYCTNAILINEFKDLVLCTEVSVGNMSEAFKSCDNTTSGVLLDDFGIIHETEWDLWRNILVLPVIGVGLMILTYIRLVTLKKVK